MTITQFLNQLANTPRNWQLCGSGCIRIGPFYHDDCPIMSLVPSSGSGRGAGEKLGLRYQDIRNIIVAADGRHSKLRNRLLAACSLPLEIDSYD